jgi:hypothetical protein
MSSAGRFAFSSTMGMIYWIHGDAPYMGFFPQPSFSAGFSNGNIFMFEITHLTNGGFTTERYQPNLTGREFNLCVFTFFGHELTITPGTSCHLPAMSDVQFNIVDMRSQRNNIKRKRVTDTNLGPFSRHQRIAHREILRREDIPFFTIYIMQKRNIGGSIWIILNKGYLGRDTILIPSEIDKSIGSFVTTAPVPGGDTPIRIPTSLFI